MPPLQFYVYN